MLVLAFDTATDVATTALLRDGEVLGERVSEAKALLVAVDGVLSDAGAAPVELDAIVVGTGPGSFTSTRIGLAAARGLALALELPVAGVSTLAALASAGTDVFPVVDARRREVFVLGPRAVAPDDLELDPGTGVHRQRRDSLPRDARGKGRARSTRRRPRAHPARAPPRRARARLRAGGVRAAHLRARSRREGEDASLSLELRRLDSRDLDIVEVIERASYPTPWSRAMFAAELRKPSALALGAYLDGGELIGYAFVSRYVDAWHVMNVAVAPEHRRRGVATELLERLFEVTATDQRRGYTLEVRMSNAGAIRLYEQLGFESRGVRRGYYTDNREDALIMWRDSVPSEQAAS